MGFAIMSCRSGPWCARETSLPIRLPRHRSSGWLPRVPRGSLPLPQDRQQQTQAFVVALMFLRLNGLDFAATLDDRSRKFLGPAEGALSKGQSALWFEQTIFPRWTSAIELLRESTAASWGVVRPVPCSLESIRHRVSGYQGVQSLRMRTEGWIQQAFTRLSHLWCIP